MDRKKITYSFNEALINTRHVASRHTAIVKIVIVISLLSLCFWYFGRNNKKSVVLQETVNVSVADVVAEDVPNTVELVGTVYAYETVAIKSRVDSQIVKVNFHDGDTVKENDILFELDDSVPTAQLKQYEANLKRDEAQLENARTQYGRYKELAAKDFVSNEKLEETMATLKTQAEAVNSSKAVMDSTRAQLAFTRITAPIAGRAGTINVTRGNNVKANDSTPLVVINRIKPILVQFAIPQRYYDAMRETANGPVEVRAGRSDAQDAIGRLEYIDNAIDTGTGSFNARAVFDNDDEKLWPGMFVSVMVLLKIDKNVPVIPQVAVQSSQEGNFVFVIDKEGKKAVKRTVEIIRMQDNKAIIKSGLQPGERVVTDGLLKLTDGSPVKISVHDKEISVQDNFLYDARACHSRT